MNRAHDGVFFLSSFKNEKETSKFNYVAMGALEGALVNVIEAAEHLTHWSCLRIVDLLKGSLG